MRRGTLGGEVDTIGSLELDLEGSCGMSAVALEARLEFLTCGSVVEVLVDKLEVASQQSRHPGASKQQPNIRRWRP